MPVALEVLLKLPAQDRRGRVRHCTLNAAPMQEAADWVNAYRPFWKQPLKSLAAFLEAEATEPPDSSRVRTPGPNPRPTQW